MIEFVKPNSGEALRASGDQLLGVDDGEVVAERRDGIFRFVEPEDDYAENFGFQWNTWQNMQSESRGSVLKHTENLQWRSGLWNGACVVEGSSLLECGMGGGDDTEVLLTLPLSEIHAFDISNSVDRAAKYLSDNRLRIFQASIYEIPYPPESFDIVWCHRVIQHTPDPEKAIRCVCRMVRPGGFLFLHSYKRSPLYMKEFKYKYRWLTKRLPRSWVYQFVQWFGWPLHKLNHLMDRNRLTRQIAYGWVPFYMAPKGGIHREMSDAQNLEWEKLATFDALTPLYDQPMTTDHFTGILKNEGFTVDWIHDPDTSPLLVRATKADR